VKRHGHAGLTEKELVVACKNVGVDLTCGACAGVFYTGSGLGEHTCSTKPAKFVQISACAEDVVFALDENGGVWRFDYDRWFELNNERRASLRRRGGP
jgi:hypothetical protein